MKIKEIVKDTVTFRYEGSLLAGGLFGWALAVVGICGLVRTFDECAYKSSLDMTNRKNIQDSEPVQISLNFD